jgi:hypothetical protein
LYTCVRKECPKCKWVTPQVKIERQVFQIVTTLFMIKWGNFDI